MVVQAAGERSRESQQRLDRLVFFSDAVFAIAMTLLVIELRLPDLASQVSDQTLATAVSGLMPQIFAYAVSFAVIGSYWLAHWRRFAMVQKVDGRLATLNLLLLGLVAAIPFPTTLLGRFGGHALPVVIYAGLLSVAGLVGTACWLYAARRDLLHPEIDSVEVRVGAVRGLAVPAVMLFSLAALPLGPGTVELLWLLILPLHWLIAMWVKAWHRRLRSDSSRSS